MFTIEHHVGRLVELRIATPIVLADLDSFRSQLRVLFGKFLGQKVVLVTDLTGATVFPQEIAAGFVSIMREDNPMIERSAFYVSQSATFSLQIERLVREANHPMRRAFRDRTALLAWLGEVLDGPERSRATLHLGRAA